jgi:hypothetical protein
MYAYVLNSSIFFKKLISINKLCPQSGLKHSAVHFKGIGMKFKRFFRFFVKILLKNDISMRKLCPQSGIKQSVVHFKGIGMKFKRLFFDFFCQNIVET